MEALKDKVMALLIDAENVSPAYINVILNEINMYGTPAYKRIYGDWTNNEMAGWKKTLLENSLVPIQQFSYTQGKNSSDSSMIIDAMDILYSKNCNGFCLVSSDSDFTRLASRLRESGMTVIGMGESKTPVSFKSACDIFKYLDVLLKQQKLQAAPQQLKKDSDKQEAKQEAKKPGKKLPKNQPQPPTPAEAPIQAEPPAEAPPAFIPLESIVAKIREILEIDSDEDGYMPLAQVGSILGRLYADFDTRNYGFSKLNKLIAHTGAFQTRFNETPGSKNLMVKNK